MIFLEEIRSRLSSDEIARASAGIDSPDRETALNSRVTLYGLESLNEVEQVEHFLYLFKIKRSLDAGELAQRLVDRFGGIGMIMPQSAKALMEVEGMYPALAKRFVEYMQMIRDVTRQLRPENVISLYSIDDMCRFVLSLYRRVKPPCTWLIVLDEGYNVNHLSEVAPSRAWGEGVALENTLERMYLFRGKYAILVQMCGSEHAKITPYDRKFAPIVDEELKRIKCRLLDSVMIDEGQIVSMYEKGLIRLDGTKPKNCQLYYDREAHHKAMLEYGRMLCERDSSPET